MKDYESALSIVGGSCWHSIGTWGDRSCEKLTRASICNSCPVYLEAGQAVLSREVVAPDYFESARPESVSECNTLVGESIVEVVVAGNRIGIPSRYVVQVVSFHHMQRIPESRIECGLVSIDGEIHVCVSGRAFFDLEGAASDDPARTKMVVLSYNGVTTVLGVDSVVSVTKVSEREQVLNTLCALSEEKRWVSDTYRVKGELVAVVDIPLLLGALEGRI